MWKRRRHAASLLQSASPPPAVPVPSLKPLTALLPLLAVLLAQTGRAQGGSSPAPASGTITGLVSAEGSGTPLPAAHVTITGTQLAASTGSDGRYTIASV